MVLDEPGRALRSADLPDPEPGPGQVLVRVAACAVCRTDLHVVDGELPGPKLPLVPGHQVVGRLPSGERVGIFWLGWADGVCRFCRSGRENLCDHARFNGYQLDGGYAELAVADERFIVPIPDEYGDAEAAPLLCAGAIGYPALRLADDAERLFPYELLWGERQVRSVANLTRADAKEFLPLAAQVPVRTQVETYPLEAANEALDRLRAGQIRGAAVLVA